MSAQQKSLARLSVQAKTETLEEFLARGGVIKHPKPIYPIVLHKAIKVATPKKKPTPPHGTRSRYLNQSCRCELCTEANANYQKMYLRKKKEKEKEQWLSEQN